MRRLLAPLLLLGTVLSSRYAFALDACQPSHDDPQMRTCAYRPTQRYIVVGVVGEPVNLTFDPTETIKRIEWAYDGVDDKGQPKPTWRGPRVQGQGQNNEGMPKDAFHNNLPIWPLVAGHSRLQVVTTTAQGQERPYQFELLARDPEHDCTAKPEGAGCIADTATTTGLAFTYLLDVKAAALAAWKVQKDEANERAAVDRLRVDSIYGKRNWAYEAHGDRKYASLAPMQISDNGWQTTMLWPGSVQPPSIYVCDRSNPKIDQIAPVVTRRDGIVVVNTTSNCFRFRLGEQAVLDVWNMRWSPNRPDPATGTTSPDVVRQIISAK